MYAAAVAALADPHRSRLLLVARPSHSALAEIDRTHRELAEIGLTRQHVVVNGVLPAPSDDTDPLATAIHRREQTALANMPTALRSLPLDLIELKATNMVGLESPRDVVRDHTRRRRANTDGAETSVPEVADRPLRDLIDDLEQGGPALVMCMGKGGVGKTTVAAAIAVALAERGHEVHLSTTDPAAHLTETLCGGVEHLHVSRIDPVRGQQGLPRQGNGYQGCIPRRAGPGQPRRRPALAVHARGRRLPGVLPRDSGITPQVRRPRHRAHRAHAAAARTRPAPTTATSSETLRQGCATSPR